MKTLHLSIILFCSFLAFFIPATSEEESITVSTDKTSYGYGGNYTVSGKVSPVLPHEAVSIMILGTNYLHPESFSFVPGSDGRYSYILPLPVKATSGGNFTIIAQYAGARNQTGFNYAGLPCNQQNIPTYANPVPIIRGPPAMNPRILDSSGNAVIGPVKVGEQIQISYDLTNGLNCNMPFAYIVQIEDHNGITVSLSWITGTLLAGQSLNPAQSWVPPYSDTYTAQIFTWQSLDNPNALVPPVSIAFDVEPSTNFTQSSQMESEVPSKLGFQTVILNSPLRQLKSGIQANNVICREDLQLLVENHENVPICVKLGTVTNLLHHDWSYPSNCMYSHNPFTAGVEGIITIERNASNQYSAKSYLPQNGTVVIDWNNTVSWINNDVTSHTVTSDWNLFDSGPILPGEDWKHTFDCAGNYGYHSEPHPWMKGWIRVLPPTGDKK